MLLINSSLSLRDDCEIFKETWQPVSGDYSFGKFLYQYPLCHLQRECRLVITKCPPNESI